MNNYFIKNFILRSPLYTYLLESQQSSKSVYKISKRYYPGGEKVMGHALKALDASSKKIPSVIDAGKILNTAVSELDDISQKAEHYNITSTSVIKPKPSVHVYDPSKIEKQLDTNYIVKKYLPLYEKEGICIPYIREKFPSHGIPGCYTLPLQEKEKIMNNDIKIIAQHAYLKVRFLMTLYGGRLVENKTDILQRHDNLYTYDADAYKYQMDTLYIHGVKAIFPILQHSSALDTFGLLVPIEGISYGSNINITTKYITLQTHSELSCLKKTHTFLITENRDELLVINTENRDELLVINTENLAHIKLLKENYDTLMPVVKQPTSDVLVTSVIGCNKKVLYPIDIKQIHEPENKLSMLSSYSSESPKYDSFLTAQKLSGQMKTQLLSLLDNSFFGEHVQALNILLANKKKGLLSDIAFENENYNYTISLFKA